MGVLSTFLNWIWRAFDPKWVNPNDIQYGVISLRLGGFHIAVNITKFENLPYKGKTIDKIYSTRFVTDKHDKSMYSRVGLPKTSVILD